MRLRGGFRGGGPALLAGLWYSICTTAALPNPFGGPRDGFWWGCFLAPLGLFWVCSRTGDSSVPPSRVRRDALMVMLGAIPFWGINQAWMWEVSEWGCIPACLLQASYAGLFVAALIVVARAFTDRRGDRTDIRIRSALPMILIAPLLWVGIEYFRGEFVFNGYAWALAGQPMIESPLKGLTSLGAVLGLYSVSFAVTLVPAIVVDLSRGRRIAAAAGLLAFAALWLVGGLWGKSAATNGAAERVPVSIAILQTNVPQDNKVRWTPETELEDWKRIAPLVLSAGQPDVSGKHPDLILWPETMMPGLTLEPEAVEALRKSGLYFRIKQPDGTEARLDSTLYFDELLEVSRRARTPMLIGEEGIDNLRLSEGESGVKIEQDARYNSVYLVRNGEIQRDRGTNGPATRYDKIHLTPFGETMPGISRWKWLEQQMLNFGGRGLKFDLGVGSRYTRFEIQLDTQPTGLQRPAALRAVTPICFEVTDSELCRRLVYEGSLRKADVIASVTNDGWFSWSDATRRQHLQIARWRCVELGVPMIRAANTGISAIVQSDGSISKELPPRSESVLRGEITIGGGTTCFASLGAVFGDLFGRGCLAITVGLFCVALWKERRIAGAKVK